MVRKGWFNEKKIYFITDIYIYPITPINLVVDLELFKKLEFHY